MPRAGQLKALIIAPIIFKVLRIKKKISINNNDSYSESISQSRKPESRKLSTKTISFSAAAKDALAGRPRRMPPSAPVEKSKSNEEYHIGHFEGCPVS